MKLPDLRNVLSVPALYTWFQRIARGNGAFIYATEHVRAETGDKILDIGCGTGEILKHMPHVEYLGFDMDEKFVRAAQEAYGHRGTFFCQELGKDTVDNLSAFDIVCATGVLHHLNDDQALELFRLAQRALKPGKRLVTLDGCYTKGQSIIGRFTLAMDRGLHVRNADEYIGLAAQVFKKVKPTMYPALFRIPQSVIIMECRD